MNRTVIAITALVALALLVVPALAAPPSVHTVAWRGSGLSADHPVYMDEVTGAQVKSDGVATERAPGDWWGRGTFTDRRNNLKADLVIINVEFPSENRVFLTGVATVRAGGIPYSNEAFELTLDRSGSEVQLVLERDMEYTWVWWIPESAFKGSIRIT